MSEADEWKKKGNASLKAKDFAKAVEHYTKAIEMDGSNHTYFSNRSAAYLHKGDFASAVQDAEKCISMKPDWGKGYVRKAQALHRAGNDRGAMETYQVGLQKCPDDASLKSAAVKLEKVLNARMAQQIFPPNYMEKLKADVKTREYLSDPTFVQMIELMRQQPMLIGQLIQSDPRMREAFRVLSGIPMSAMPQSDDQPKEEEDMAPRHRQTRNHWAPKPKEDEEDKEKEEKEEVKVDPEVAARQQKALTLKNEGNELYKLKKFDEAIAKYYLAAETDPSNMTFLLNVGSAQMGKKDYDACIKVCRQALDVSREHSASFENKAKAYGRIGKAYMRMKKWAEAIDAFDSGLLEADDKQIVKMRKKAVREKSKADALAYQDPEKAQEAKEKGNELFRAGEYAKSVSFYSEAIKRAPKDAVYYMNRAAAYTKLMEFDRGLTDCEKALELDPTNTKGYYRKGNIEIMLKKYNKAMDSFRTGLKLKPGDKACTIGLQQVMAKINEAASSNDAEAQQARAKEAMKDPEIQAILADPVMRSVLEDLNDPSKVAKHMQNADVRAKIEKLVAAGIIGGRMA